jgi:hypothetical protein
MYLLEAIHSQIVGKLFKEKFYPSAKFIDLAKVLHHYYRDRPVCKFGAV